MECLLIRQRTVYASFSVLFYRGLIFGTFFIFMLLSLYVYVCAAAANQSINQSINKLTNKIIRPLPSTVTNCQAKYFEICMTVECRVVTGQTDRQIDDGHQPTPTVAT